MFEPRVAVGETERGRVRQRGPQEPVNALVNAIAGDLRRQGEIDSVLVAGGGFDWSEAGGNDVYFHTVDAQYNSTSGFGAYAAYLGTYRHKEEAIQARDINIENSNAIEAIERRAGVS